MRYCPKCRCTQENACLTTRGACSWTHGSDLCSACASPSIKLSGPDVEEEARTVAGLATLGNLCHDARTGDADDIRWFWCLYGRELRGRLETALRCLTTIAA